MGSARPRPARLAEKLLFIRERLDLSQGGMVERLGLEDEFDRERISKYERGVLEPPWYVLCAYADIANIFLEVLVKDEIDLPDLIPAREKSLGKKRAENNNQD